MRTAIFMLSGVALSLTAFPACSDSALDTMAGAGSGGAPSFEADVPESDGGSPELAGASGVATGETDQALPEPCKEVDYISGDLELGPGCVILDEIDPTNAKVTILPGTTVRMRPNASFAIRYDAVLDARGTQEEPIVFQSSSDDPLPGDWGCFYIQGSTESAIEHVVIQHAGASCYSGVDATAAILDSSVRLFRDVTIRDSRGIGLIVRDHASNVRDFGNLRFDQIQKTSLRVEPEGLSGVQGPIELDADDTYIELDASPTAIDVFEEVTWRNLGFPYRVDGDLLIYAPLTIEPGVVLELSGGVELGDKGQLLAEGSASEPIVWTSGRESPRAGDWGCIFLNSNRESLFHHNVFEYAGGGCTGDQPLALYLGFGARVSFQDLSFRHIVGPAIGLRSCDYAAAQPWCDFSYESVEAPVSCVLDEEFRCTE